MRERWVREGSGKEARQTDTRGTPLAARCPWPVRSDPTCTRVALLAWLVSGSASACGAGAVASAPDADHAAVADHAAKSAAATTVEVAAPEAHPARTPLAHAGSCPLRWERREVGSVLRIPADVMARPMDRVVDAACRCVRPGEAVAVVADIDFFAGRVAASSSDVVVGRCLADVDMTFEPYREGGTGDCIDCGPRRFGVFRGSPPVDAARGAGLRVTYPLAVDRSRE